MENNIKNQWVLLDNMPTDYPSVERLLIEKFNTILQQEGLNEHEELICIELIRTPSPRDPSAEIGEIIAQDVPKELWFRRDRTLLEKDKWRVRYYLKKNAARDLSRYIDYFYKMEILTARNTNRVLEINHYYWQSA